MDTKISGWKFEEKQGISKLLPIILLNYKGKNTNFTVEKPSRHHLNQVIKTNITSKKTIRHQVLSDTTHWKEYIITSMVFFLKMYSLNLTMRNCLKNSKWGTCYQNKTKLNSTLHKCKGYERQGQNEELSQTGEDYDAMTTKCNVGLWTGSRNRKKNTTGNTSEIWIKFVL